MQMSRTIVAALVAVTSAFPHSANPGRIAVESSPPPDANRPLEHFLSYSIEFSSFADFAGNLSTPNTYSNNLLDSIAHYAGSKPLVRVGGNTQDLTLFNASQQQATIQTFNPVSIQKLQTLAQTFPIALSS